MGPMAHREGIGHASSWGYACFLTVNATSVWGGIFPFLPLEFQTIEVTLTFFLAQAVALGGAFVASMWGSYYFPHGARRMMVSLSAILLFLGSACLIAAMYVAPAALVLVAAGGVLLGIGCAGMFMLWQRYFASLPPRAGNFRLIVGTAIAPFIYFALYLVPIALTAFLVPLVFVPLCGLCVALSVREMRFDQPMFEDVPRQHPRVYRQAVADYWRSALCVGSLAFAGGVIRGVALLHEEISAVVNGASMIELPPISWTREMGGFFMSGRPLYDAGVRRRAVELYEEGHGRDVIAYLVGAPEGTVRKWLDTYRSVGIGALAAMGAKKKTYSFDTKVAAVRAVEDEGSTVPEAMARFGIVSSSPLRKWLKAYREGGPEALRPKPKGRPKGAKAAPGPMTREQELERRVQKLEAENAYLKKSIALKAEKRSRTARRRRS